MNILLVTDNGASLGLADRLNSEGNSVYVYARESIGGFSSRLFQYEDNLHKGVRDAKFVICDIPGWDYLDKRADIVKRPIIGSHSAASVPNTDSIKQYSLFKRFEVPMSRSEIFDDVGDAIKAALSWDASRTIIRHGNSEFRCDYKDWLSWAILRIPVGQKILFQELVVGYETLLTGWFDGFDWVDAFTIAPSIQFHLSKFATVVPVDKSKPLVVDTFNKLTDYFKHWEYRGPVHLEVVLTEKGIFVQKMHVGFQFPLDYTIMEVVQGDLSRFLNGIAYPNNFRVQKTKDFVGVVQADCVGDELAGAPILGLNPERLKHLVFHNVVVDITDGTYQVGPPPLKTVFTAFAHGPNVGDLCDRVYKTVEAVKFPEKHFNGNMASSVNATFEKLKSWGHI